MACWRDPAREAGADLAAITVVQKLSTLIAALRGWLIEIPTRKLISEGAVSLRGATDEAWQRAMLYVLRGESPVALSSISTNVKSNGLSLITSCSTPAALK